MQRFFCLICQRVKRVRKLPLATLVGSEGNYSGECPWHLYSEMGGQQSHAAFMGRDGIPINPTPKPNPKPAVQFPPKPSPRAARAAARSRVIDYTT